jgi:ADP-heptose:LPS heptosyltransferase
MSFSPKSKLIQVVYLPQARHEVILSLPFIYKLVDQLKIDVKDYGPIWLVGPMWAHEIIKVALLARLNSLSSFIHFTSDFEKEVKEKESKFSVDTCYCLDRSFRAGFKAWRSKAKRRIGYSTDAPSFFYTDTVPLKLVEGYSVIERSLDLLRARWTSSQIEEWNTTHAPSILAKDNSVKSSEPLVAIHLDKTRQIPSEALGVFCKILVDQGVEVWLLGDLAASPDAETVQRIVPSLLIKNLCAPRTFDELLLLISKSHILVSVNLEVIHVASDLNVPVVSQLDSVLVELGYGPWRRKASVISISGNRCLACVQEARGTKVQTKHKCLTQVSGEKLYSEARRFSDFLS